MRYQEDGDGFNAGCVIACGFVVLLWALVIWVVVEVGR